MGKIMFPGLYLHLLLCPGLEGENAEQLHRTETTRGGTVITGTQLDFKCS